MLLGMVGVGEGEGFDDGVFVGVGVGSADGIGVFFEGVAVFGDWVTDAVFEGSAEGWGVTGLFAEVTRVMMVMAMMAITVRASTP